MLQMIFEIVEYVSARCARHVFDTESIELLESIDSLPVTVSPIAVLLTELSNNVKGPCAGVASAPGE